MSHQVIITFDLDENKVQENAEKEAGRQLAREIINEAFGSTFNRSGLMRNWVQDTIREMLEPHKEEIIEGAIREVAASLSRTKAAKEKLAEMLDEVGGDGKEGS